MSQAAANKTLTLKLLGFALGSFAFGFALVPLYDVLCDLTGFGNQKSLAEQRLTVEAPDDSRTITVDFVADLPTVGNWEFRPLVASMQIHPGRLYETEFVAHNLTGRDDGGAGGAEHRARPGRGLFPQDRMFLFHAAEVRGRTRRGPWPCASWSILRFRARSTASRFRTLSMTSPREWVH